MIRAYQTLLLAACFGVFAAALTQAPQNSSAQSSDPSAKIVQILSETKGFDVQPYANTVAHKIYRRWLASIPDVAYAPGRKQGGVAVEFSIKRKGKIADVHVVESSGDARLDASAVESIKASSPVSPLPSEFGEDHLALRIQFAYNPNSNANSPAKPGQEVRPPVYRIGGSVTAPHAIYAPDPDYSDEARKKRIEGLVVLYVVVGADGATRDIKVVRSLGYGLDEEAVKAVQLWKFNPATKDGIPVAVAVNVETHFRLSLPTSFLVPDN